MSGRLGWERGKGLDQEAVLSLTKYPTAPMTVVELQVSMLSHERWKKGC
jgi:hypothetical protein